MLKNAILTFDYEVFLGRKTGTIENCVIKPTNLILDILKNNNAKAIFFVDATWLLYLKEHTYPDYKKISLQLKEISKSGSSIELHLHPQWLQASQMGENITFKSLKHYRIHSLSNEEILDLFKNSKELLENISNQKINCFRAGGWCIEPFSSVKDAFETNGIKYDFSVVPGVKLKEGKIYDFDFTEAPKLLFYEFNSDVCQPESKGRFMEFPVSTFNNNPAYRIANKIFLFLKKDKIMGDGTGSKEKSLYRTLYNGFQFSKNMLSIDKTSNFFFKYLLKTHFRKPSLLVIISHPKTVSREALNNLSYISKNYNTLNSSDLVKFIAN